MRRRRRWNTTRRNLKKQQSKIWHGSNLDAFTTPRFEKRKESAGCSISMIGTRRPDWRESCWAPTSRLDENCGSPGPYGHSHFRESWRFVWRSEREAGRNNAHLPASRSNQEESTNGASESANLAWVGQTHSPALLESAFTPEAQRWCSDAQTFWKPASREPETETIPNQVQRALLTQQTCRGSF